MRRVGRRISALALPCAVACLVLAGCGGTKSSRPRGPETVTLLMARAPNSLDPAIGDTPEALEADWLVYTPLLTYAHAGGVPGTQVISGLTTDPPTIRDGGRIYTLTLRPGLVYSDGEPLRASDFTWAVERAIRLGWVGAPQLITRRIVGAAAFAAGRARTISGISTDDTTGEIAIHLTAPWGPFDNVLALPVMAPIPRTTPLRDESSHPPTGIGAYEFGKVVPGRAFSLVHNPRWQPGHLPGSPPGHVDVDVRITGNARLNATAVLENTADVFDSADRIPSTLLPRILGQAARRYSKQAVNSTDVIFMNVARRPFTSQLARIAVQTALNERTLKRLGSDTFQEGCFLLPPSLWGHPHDQCPRGDIEKGGDVAAARALVARSGMAGSRVTVWSAARPPVLSWMAYYTSLLNQIGFRARLKLVRNANYFATIGNLKLHPQTGFGQFSPELQSPVDFYERLIGSGILAVDNQNWGEIDDAYLNRQVAILGAVPATNLAAVSSFWHGLEDYVADRAYLAVFGYETAPVFVSDRLNPSSVRLSPVVGLDWSSFRLKQ
jgi:peptide/nickel transport system substrate-binding protein